MNPRQRRLTADAEMMRSEFAGHPNVTVEPLGWEPPERYRVHLRLPTVRIDDATGQPAVAHDTSIVVTLPAGYPREKPLCTTETPVFHPNIGGRAGDEICIADYWVPSQTLVDIVAKIGSMLQYQLYNVKSPLNAIAAQWVIDNPDAFPIGDVQLFQAEPAVEVLDGRAGGSNDDGADTHGLE
jgi:ubiquitin-protein ligase